MYYDTLLLKISIDFYKILKNVIKLWHIITISLSEIICHNFSVKNTF